MYWIIYRKSDRLIAGQVHPRRTPEASEHAVRVEIENICMSDLAGTPDDYATVEVSQAQMAGYQASVSPEGEVTFAPLTPGPEAAQVSRLTELLETPRSSWTASMRSEIIEITARTILGVLAR